MEKIPFGYSIHPGDILKTEFMEPLGLSSYRLAKELHVSAPRVNDLVRGKRSRSMLKRRTASFLSPRICAMNA